MVFSIGKISSEQAMRLVDAYHYSHRRVGAKFSFGLYVDRVLSGCCVFSVPASYTLCKGVCGEELKSSVLELSRLVITSSEKNCASFLIGNSLRKLRENGDWIVVSYADCNEHVGHVGYVYQATNWLYTGNATAEPIWIDPRTNEVVSYTRRHIDTKAAALGIDWRDLTKQPQIGKHRYVTFAGSKPFERKARQLLRYKVGQYPKGNTRRHSSKVIVSQTELF